MRPREVVLQPYAIESLRLHCFCVYNNGLPKDGRVWVTVEAEDRFALSIPEHGGFRCVTFACPEKCRDLFYQEPGTAIASKVLDLVKSTYESWKNAHRVEHAFMLPKP